MSRRNTKPFQLALDFTGAPSRKERVRIWLWCSYLARVEANEVGYACPPPEGEERERRNEQLGKLEAASARFYAKAEEVAGEPLSNDAWIEALDALGGYVD